VISGARTYRLSHLLGRVCRCKKKRDLPVIQHSHDERIHEGKSCALKGKKCVACVTTRAIFRRSLHGSSIATTTERSMSTANDLVRRATTEETGPRRARIVLKAGLTSRFGKGHNSRLSQQYKADNADPVHH